MNPEFRRQLWLEITPQRLIIMPLVLASIATLNSNAGNIFGPHLGVKIYLVFMLVWGTRRAISSLADEIRDKTWDTQKMSALSAWDMTMGKMFGGTIFVWYGGAICLIYDIFL